MAVRLQLVVVILIFSIYIAASPLPAYCLPNLPNAVNKNEPRLEEGLPFIRTFNYKHYKAKPQNWSVVQDSNGLIYVANTGGILVFDGSRWKVIDIANQAVVRSLAIAPDGRIFVGAVGEIGYLDIKENGQIRYVSLMDKIPETAKDFSDVWQIYATKDGMVFSTFHRVFRLQGDHFESWVPTTSYHLSFHVGERLFVREKKVGLFELIDAKLTPVPDGERFANERIYAMLPWRYNGQDVILVATRTQGLMIFNDKGFIPWPTDIDDVLVRDLIFPVIKLRNNVLAIGTLQKGVYFVDKNGKQIGHLSTDDGLPDNAILALLLDKEQGLWIATDNGLARAEVDNPLTYFDENRGLVGVNYAVYRHQAHLYVGTTHGLFKLTAGPRARFIRITGIDGQTWGLTSFDNELLVANYQGLYSVRNGQVSRIVESDSAMSVYRSKIHPSRVYVGLREGVLILRREAGTWYASQRIAAVNDEVRTFLEDEQGRLWVGTKSKGLMRITFVRNKFEELVSSLRIERFGKSDGLPSLIDSWVYAVNNQPRFSTKEGIYLFDESSKTFKVDPDLKGLFARPRAVWSIVDDPSRGIWFYTQEPDSNGAKAGLAQRQSNHEYQWNARPLRPIISSVIEGMQHIHLDSDGTVWFGGSDGVYRYDANIKKNYNYSYKALLRRVSSNNRNIASKQNLQAATLNYANNAVRFVYSAPSFDGQNAMLFSVFLVGHDKAWSDWSVEDYRDYNNLYEGKYQFKVRAKNIYDVISEEATFSFIVLPPWYRTIWAYLGYLILVLCLAKGVIEWRLKQIRAQTRLLEMNVADRTKQLSSLGDIGRAITANLDLDAALEFLYEQLNKMIDASVFGIGLYYPEKQKIEFRLAIENGKRYQPYERDMSDKNQLAVWCIEKQQPIAIGDYSLEYTNYIEKKDDMLSVLSDNTIGKPPLSLLYVPLMLKGKVIGLISTQSANAYTYDESHLDLLKTLAAYTAIAVDNARAHAALEEISYTDPLTGLHNRRFLLQHLGKDIAVSLRTYNDWLDKKKLDLPTDTDLLFFLVDIDHFKKINDEYGHLKGDKVLIGLAKIMKDSIRDADFISRWGGEEFVVLAHNCHVDNAFILAEKIRQKVTSSKLIEASLSVSIGISEAEDGDIKDKLLNRADSALYVAKSSGRNQTVIFDRKA